MRFFLSQLLFTEFVSALFLSIVFLLKNRLIHRENRLFFIFCMSSTLWSLGFYGVHIQTSPDYAYFWRGIGMVGTIGYLITAVLLMTRMSTLPKPLKIAFNIFPYIGMTLYFPIIHPSQVIYENTSIGMSYSFVPGIWNNLYTIYSVLIGVCGFFITIYMMVKSPTKRQKVIGRKFLCCIIALFIGMLFDTALPFFGIKSFPGSTIGQFIGLIVMYYTIVFINQSRINISNMSEFVYYSLTVPVMVYDSDRKLKILNSTAYQFLGIPDEEYQIEGLSSLFYISSKDAFDFEGKSRNVDATCTNNDIFCNLSINKIHDKYEDVIGYIIIVTDLSEKLRTMQDLEEATILAKKANQAKSIFLANMSHEIRTPMNGIMGFAELLLKMDLTSNVRRHVEDIKWSSHNLLTIINDILDISKIESGKMELVCSTYYTGSFLSDISLIIAPQAEKKGLEFCIRMDNNIPTALYGDKTRLRSIMINLLNNAIKYTQEGSVTLDVRVLDKTPTHVTLQYVISDTGMGIKEEELEFLFESFERLDKQINHEVEGTGLGLNIANKYIQLMGGSILVDSKYQEGSTFTITFEQELVDPTPLSKEFNKKDSTISSISDMKIKGLHVLVTDDNLINLSVASGILSYYGLEVDTAENGPDSIELCKSNSYDMIFMDQMMPKMDGIETMSRIRSIGPHYDKGGRCKIIVLTADAIKGTREALLEKGFDEYLGKPINFNHLETLFKKFVDPVQIYYETEDVTEEIVHEETPDTIYLKEVLSDIDVHLGITNCGGNVKDYITILQITHEYGDKQLNELSKLWEDKDYDHYTIKIHSLKSTTLNIGATTLSNLAKKLEENGKNKNYEYIDTYYSEFQERYAQLMDKIAIVLEHYKDTPDEEAITKELTWKEAEQYLIEIQKAIDNFNFTKVFDILAEVNQYESEKEISNLFTKISHLMDDLAVEEVSDIIKSYL